VITVVEYSLDIGVVIYKKKYYFLIITFS
jgi:hypothetical protein